MAELSEQIQLPDNRNKKSNKKFEIQMYSKIMHDIDNFFSTNQITDEQVRKAVCGK